MMINLIRNACSYPREEGDKALSESASLYMYAPPQGWLLVLNPLLEGLRLVNWSHNYVMLGWGSGGLLQEEIS